MKKILTYYSLGLITAFGLIVTGAQAFDFTSATIVRENYENRARFEVVCERVRNDLFDLSFVCDGRPKPSTPTPESCGNDMVETGEECDGSAPEGFMCSDSCKLVEIGSEAICGNSIVEPGEECDGSAPEGFVCSNRCELIDEKDLTKGEVVINEIHFDVDASHGVEPANEWIELYNTGTTTVDLFEWTITDNSNISMIINKSVVLEPGEFAILTSENSTNLYWTFPEGTAIIVFGTHIGNSLDNAGDSLTLKNSAGIADRVSWGNDHSVFDLPTTRPGNSLGRIVNGFDTNTAGDWMQLDPPTPGF